MNIQIIDNQENQNSDKNQEDNENFDINNFKQVIRNQNLTLLSINIKELQVILNNYIMSLEQLCNNEDYLLNLFKL